VKFTEEGEIQLSVISNQLSVTSEQLSGISGPSSEEAAQLITDHWLLFTVKDTGIGIAPDEVDTIFETFGRTQSSQTSKEGAGLGLAISRQFIQLMGGDIRVESEVGKGSVFTFEIQAEAAEMVEGSLEQPARRVIGLEPNQATYRILIAEDKAESRRLLSQLLQSVGFEVRGAANGQEALEVFEQWQPHLIWMDMRMPVMDGYTTTREIRNPKSEIRNIPIIALTASAFEKDRTEILAAGCTDFVRKPFKEDDIFDMLAKYLGVRYVYEESRKPKAESRKSQVEEVVTPESLAALPADLLTDLEQAARRSNMQQISEILTKLRTHDTAVADALARLADEFQYEAMLALLRQHKEETP